MGTLKKDFKFKIVKNFLSEEERTIGLYYLLNFHKKNTSLFDFTTNINGDSFISRDAFVETILIRKLNLMQSETNLELIPTYAFSRIYSYNADLRPHTDRPSCEVSATIMWGSCGTSWPIYMDGQECEMEPGDAVIYLGCELEHYRKNFEGDWHAQSFIHYVDKNGPFKEYAYDKRCFYSSPEINFDIYNNNVRKKL
jgi:hypothetical protein